MARCKRLFFALWPPTSVQECIVRSAGPAIQQGKPVARERLHLTLAFLGNVDHATAAALIANTQAIKGQDMPLTLLRLGYFHRARTMWLGPEDPPAALGELVAALHRVTRAAGIDSAARQFRPHVTLARSTTPPGVGSLSEPIHWRARHFSLTESTQVDGRPIYRDLAQYFLSAV